MSSPKVYTSCHIIARRFASLSAASGLRRSIGARWWDIDAARAALARLEADVLARAAAHAPLDLRYRDSRALAAAALAVETGFSYEKCLRRVERAARRVDTL